jgi:Predicted nucleic acid-binding protein, contains PIN domain
MSVYVDTSVLVAAHCSEKHTGLAQGWLEELSDAELIISAWTLLECESALAIKVRRQELDLSNQSAVLDDIQVFADMYAPFPVPDEQDYGQARKFCRLAGCGLRAGDALHLASGIGFALGDAAIFDTGSFVGKKCGCTRVGGFCRGVTSHSIAPQGGLRLDWAECTF